nr:MAG TPA: homing endonuclease [Caudoviricetes sp.]
MQEIWKDIEDYEGLYQVSNKGRVKSIERYSYKGNRSIQKLKERILKVGIRKDNYLTVVLRKNGKSTSYLVHRLVAQNFIPNPHGYNVVNHKDENKQNNDIRNLEWCSSLYNNTYNNIAIRRQVNKKKHWKFVNGKRFYY